MKTKISFTDIRFRVYYLTLFKYKTFLRRKISKALQFSRPASHPFITGDGFRSIADHVYDELSDIYMDTVQKRDIVFVRGDFLPTFFKKIHPHIKNPYILLSHNSDENIDTRFEDFIDNKIIHWFAQNLKITHPRITPIPIGLHLRIYDRKNKVIELLKKFQNKKLKKERIFFGCDISTNIIREKAAEELAKHPLCDNEQTHLDRETYYEKMSNYKVVASPEGNGIDCHRTWESLYLGSVPIVTKNPCVSFWADLGIPLMVIESWEDVNKITEKDIVEVSKKMNTCRKDYLDMSFWINKIVEYKNSPL